MIKLKVKENRALFKRKRDNYGNKLRKKKVINYLRTELESSTTHGLPYIVNQDINSTERVFWLFSFMACLGLVIYLLSAQLARFIETPTVMSVEMDYFNWNVSYPAFTLCPLIKPDADAFTDIVNEINNNTGKDLRKYLWTIISANIRTLQILDLNPADIASIDPKDYVDIASRTFRKIPDDSLTTNTNQPISIDVAMTELGMCHVINSNVAVFHDPSKWSNSVMTMPYSKNNIELSVHNKDFFSQIMNYADVYEVLIHSPDETILSTTSSYTISKTGFISFGVQVWSSRISDVLRLTSVRLRRCRFIDEPISQRYPIYTYNHCMLECKIQMIINLCDCVPHFYKSLDHERICNISELKCVLNYKKEIMTLSVSEKTLRHKGYSDRLPRSPRDCACLNNCETDMYLKDYENFIPESTMTRLRIGISTFPKLRTVKDIIFSFNEIILKSGGVVNLCIGSSVLSLVEFILIFIRIPIANLLQKVKRRVFNN